MSRFYGSLKGQAKSTATRRGSVSSGVSAHVRGWDMGIWVGVGECPYCGKDYFEVHETGGSNNPDIIDDANAFFTLCSNNNCQNI